MDTQYADLHLNSPADEDVSSDSESSEHVSDGSLCSSTESVAGEVAREHDELNLLSSEGVFSNCDERHSSYEKNIYQYNSLPPDSIRLFQIQLDESKISLIMKSFSVAERPPYVALSYTWGRSDKVEIIVNGERKYVWKNLWRFLHQARSSMPNTAEAKSSNPSAKQRAQSNSIGSSTWLWVDALCIDQNNVAERNEQVLKMPHIYRDAACVIIWLGPTYSGSDAAIDRFNAGRHFSLVASREGHDIAFSLLCDRLYWSRLWVFQEVILARHIIMFCGSRKVQWQRFRDFVLRICDDTNSWDSRAARIIQDSPARQILSRTAHQPTDDICLLDLLLSTSDLKCADPRDRIYAMLGSSRKGHQGIVPDYSLPLPTLLNKVLRSHHLDFEPCSLDDVEEQCRRIDSVFHEQGSCESIFDLVGGPNEYHRSANFEKHALKRQNGPSSLWWTTYYNHEAVTKLLVQDRTVHLTAWLKEAVKDGDLAAVEVLWSHIATPDTDLLNHAVDNGDQAMVKLLLKQGLTSATKGGGFLHRAAGNIDVTMVKLLLSEGFTFGKMVESSYAVLKASYANRLDALELLLEHGFDPNCAWMDTPLADACRKGHVQAVQLLLDFGADPNLTYEYRTPRCYAPHDSPLSCASRAGHVAIVELLLSSGSNVNACTEHRVPLLHEDADVCTDYGWSPLYWAIRGNHLEIMELLLRDGADVEQCCKQHTRLLQSACLKGSIDAVKLLLQAGADINALSKPHGTALHAAIESCRLDIVTLLLDHNADCDIATYIGPALHRAADKGHTQIVALLLERGAHLSLSTEVGSALHVAAVSDHLESVRLLLDHGADPDFATGCSSPLHAAVENGAIAIVKLLIKCGANCSIKTLWGSPLHIAAENGYIAIAELLLEKGADINAVAPPGTPLDHAMDSNQLVTAEFLSARGARRSGKDKISRTISKDYRKIWSRHPHDDEEAIGERWSESALAHD